LAPFAADLGAAGRLLPRTFAAAFLRTRRTASARELGRRRSSRRRLILAASRRLT